MPEGDTVLRTALGLHRALAGRRLTNAELRWAELGDVDLTGRTVLEATAYGKHLLIRLDALDASAAAGSSAMRSRGPDEPATLHTHLRMDGSWRIHATAATTTPRCARSSATRNGPRSGTFSACSIWSRRPTRAR